MIIPVRCFTCGKLLSDKYNFYNKELLNNNINNHIPNISNIDDPLVINISAKEVKKTIVGVIMDNIGLTRDCCRKNMMTNINIIEDI